MITDPLRPVADAPGLTVFAARRACLKALLALPTLPLATAQAGEPAAVLTLLEGGATVVVGSRALAAATGARLGAGTLIETESSTALLRLEWPDGTLLDLGPATRAVLQPGPVAGRVPLVYLLQGWAKLSQTKPAAGQAGALFDVAPFAGVLVSQVDEGQSVLFAEAGGGPFTARRQGVGATLKGGDTTVLSGATAPQITARPPTAWLQQMPRAFRETLPPMVSKIKGPAPSLRPRAVLTYAALQPWLVAESAIRRDFPSRFAERLNDRAFREAVTRHLAQHPEWDVVLKQMRTGTIAR